MRRNKTIMTLLASLSLILFSLQAQAETLTIVGTGDGVSLLTALGEEFTATHPDITVSVPKSIGSGGGIKAVGNDEFLLGRVARPIKEKEEHYGLTYTPFASIPVVFFVNKSVTVTSLGSQQVLDIYSGKITDWKQVGGAEGKIRVVRREDGDSSLKVLQKKMPGFADITLTDKSKTAVKTYEMFSLVAGKKGAIGFGPYDIAKTNPDVTILAIDNLQPLDPAYKMTGTMGLVYKEKNKTGAVQQFLEFVGSDQAADIISQQGGSQIK